MKIVECLTHNTPGGGQQVVYTLVKYLKTHHEDSLTVILPAFGYYVDRFKALGVEVITCPLNQLNAFTRLRLKDILASVKPDLVHSHGKGAGFHARLAMPRSTTTARIHSYHGYHVPGGVLAGTLYRSLERNLLHRTNAVVNVSASEMDLIAADYPFAFEMLNIIPNVVDEADIRERSVELLPDELEAFLISRRNDKVITMIGRNDLVKNFPLALASAVALLEKGLPVSFIFIGPDPEEPQLAAVLKRFPKSVFVLPFLDNTPALIRRSSAILMTSKREGAPLVVLEALALCVPIVGTNVEGIRDLVKNGQHGLLCEQNAASVVAAITRLVEEPNLATNLRHDIAEDPNGMSVEEWADAYQALYHSFGG